MEFFQEMKRSHWCIQLSSASLQNTPTNLSHCHLLNIKKKKILGEVDLASNYFRCTEGTEMIPIYKKTGILQGFSYILNLKRSKCRQALGNSLPLDHAATDRGTSVFPPHCSPEDLTPHGAAAQLPDPIEGAVSCQLNWEEWNSPLRSSLNQIWSVLMGNDALHLSYIS